MNEREPSWLSSVTEELTVKKNKNEKKLNLKRDALKQLTAWQATQVVGASQGNCYTLSCTHCTCSGNACYTKGCY
jgi:hypothetical protein